MLGTPAVFGSLTQEAIWFAGTGLAMCFLGLVNIGPWQAAPAWYRRGAIIANGIWLALMFGLLTTSRSGRVVAAVAIATACLVGSLGRMLRGEAGA